MVFSCLSVGTNCEEDVAECASEPCLNGAQCVEDDVAQYMCECEPGFTGTHCETDIDECDSRPCQNGATCEDKVNGVTCYCLKGFQGKMERMMKIF